MVSSRTEIAGSDLALLESAASKAEAAWAVLADRRCSPAEAAPLLELGWLRLAKGLGLAGEAAAPFARLTAPAVPGLDPATHARLQPALEKLAAQAASVRERDPELSRQELDLLAAALATCARASLRRASPPALRKVLLKRAPVLVAVAAFAVGLAALAMPRRAAETGWRGRYYKGTDFKGAPREQRDPTISFFWDTGSPLPGFPADLFTVRWDGCLRVDKAGVARFSLGSDDESRLFVDGRQVIDNWRPHSLTFANGTLQLMPGVHWVRVDYEEGTGDAAVMLKLGWDGAEPRPVDSWSVLYPGNSEPNPCASLK